MTVKNRLGEITCEKHHASNPNSKICITPAAPRSRSAALKAEATAESKKRNSGRKNDFSGGRNPLKKALAMTTTARIADTTSGCVNSTSPTENNGWMSTK